MVIKEVEGGGGAVALRNVSRSVSEMARSRRMQSTASSRSEAGAIAAAVVVEEVVVVVL